VTNVLILMSDEHNYRVSSVYGHPRVETPNMERLARTGIVCDAAYCPSPLCAPSRSSFLAGLPVHQTQVYNNCRLEDAGFPSYGGVLHEQGVHSVNIGKTDAYASGDKLGFSEMRLPGDRKPPGDVNFCRKPLGIRRDGPDRANGFGPKADAFAKDIRVVDDAVAWLASRATTIDSPWTLTVNILAPHFPHYATPDLWKKYEADGDLPRIGGDASSANHPYALDLRRHFQTDTFTEAQVRGLRQGYLAGVDFVDVQLGRLLDALDASEFRENTIVAYTSDHGEMLGKFGMWWKCSMYEDSLRVPLIVSGPGFPCGKRSTTPVSLLDLQAALFRATGATRPAHWWGTPLQEIPIDDHDRVVFAEYHGHGTRAGTFMIRKGSWKLLVHAEAPDQLFNLDTDPDELVNVFADRPDVARELGRELSSLCAPEAEFERADDYERHQMRQVQKLGA
jgi:choline-sulfatase